MSRKSLEDDASEDDSEDDSDSEDDTIGATVAKWDRVTYTRKVLNELTRQLSKPPYLQPNGEPMYILTSGATGPGKVYQAFDGAHSIALTTSSLFDPRAYCCVAAQHPVCTLPSLNCYYPPHSHWQSRR